MLCSPYYVVPYYVPRTTYCVLRIAYCVLHNSCYILHNTYYLLHVTYYVLRTAYYVLRTTYYMLHMAHAFFQSIARYRRRSTRACVRGAPLLLLFCRLCVFLGASTGRAGRALAATLRRRLALPGRRPTLCCAALPETRAAWQHRALVGWCGLSCVALTTHGTPLDAVCWLETSRARTGTLWSDECQGRHQAAPRRLAREFARSNSHSGPWS